MDLQQQALPVEDLSVGMYVSALDRPWLETPFLFQGFLIEDAEVIDQLREYCKVVYIDREKGDSSIAPPSRKQGQSRDEHKPELADEQDRTKLQLQLEPEKQTEASKQNDDHENDTTELKKELVHAREAYSSTERAVSDLFTRLQSGEALDASNVKRALDPMIDSVVRNDDAMSWLARMKKKGDYIHDHSIASSVWAMLFGKHLGLNKDDLQVVGTGALFFDVGKTMIDDELLTKETGLTPAETSEMRKHVEYSVDIVSRMEGIDPRVIEMVAGHHERYNGTGYPRGLSGAEISVFARIAGIVDAYDAMTTPRPYAPPKSTFDAIRQLRNLSGVEFPEEVVEKFVQAIGVFPVGSLVELNTGEVGIVIAQNRVRRLRPKVMLLLDANKNNRPDQKIVDLRNQLADENGSTSLWIDKGLAPGDYGIDPSEYYL